MPEMLNGKRTGADVVEWRLARPEDGPVWVALTREGRTPLVPREALVEPDQRVLRDQQEQHDELARFLDGSSEQRARRFLLWRASRPLGRLCFNVRDAQAQLEGIALLPSAGREVIEQVARAAVERAQEAGARSIRAAYEARHAAAFGAAGFQELRRYTPMVAATRRMEEEEEDEAMGPGVVSMVYRVRPIEYDDSRKLSALFHDTSLDEVDTQEPSPTDWLAEMAQLHAESDNAALPECSFVAELRQKPELVGAVLVSRWQGAALIDDLMVLPGYQRQGIGTALLQRALQCLHQRGYVAAMLVVTEGAPVQAFYRQLGFREVQPSYVEAERVLT
ncbi:MAG TPA: GNAT family N-acetyltransferase [Ktedonobacterales bacterium]|nr:GNAT family N-acetyltransferase [Ktedonobacterales bacterium]